MQFPDPPLTSLHWEVRKYCEVDFVDCVQYLHEVRQRHSSYHTCYFIRVLYIKWGRATNRKVAGSIPDDVIEIFQ